MKRFWKGTAVFAAAMLAAAGLGWGLMALAPGTSFYMRLFMQDDVFLQALFNTLLMPALLALVLTAGFVVLKRLVFSRWHSRLREPVCYAGLTLVLFFFQAARLPWLLGWPSSDYAVDVLAESSTIIPAFFGYFHVPIYLLLGTLLLELSLILALLAWLADCLLSAGRRKRQGMQQADENAVPGDRA